MRHRGVITKRFLKKHKLLSIISFILFMLMSTLLYFKVERNGDKLPINKNVIPDIIKIRNDELIEFPDYDNSDIRSEWKFSITKNYQHSKLFSYSPAHLVKAVNSSAPGENGKYAFNISKLLLNNISPNRYRSAASSPSYWAS